MTTEQIFLLVSVLVAGLIVIAGLVALLAGRARTSAEAGLQPVGPGLEAAPSRQVPLHHRVDRCAPGLDRSGSLPRHDSSHVVGDGGRRPHRRRRDRCVLQPDRDLRPRGLALVAVVVFHEVIPDRWRTPITSAAEVASADRPARRAGHPDRARFVALCPAPHPARARGGPRRPAVRRSRGGARCQPGVRRRAGHRSRPPFTAGAAPRGGGARRRLARTVSAVVFAAQQRRLQARPSSCRSPTR